MKYIKIDDIFPSNIKLIETHPAIYKTKHRLYEVVIVALWTHLVLLVEKDQKLYLLNSEHVHLFFYYYF